MKLKSLLIFVLTLISASPASIKLAWDQNTETNITRYVIYWSVNGAAPTQWIIPFPGTTFTTVSLQPGTSNVFYVTAVNSSFIESTASASVGLFVPNLPAPVNVLKVAPSGLVNGNWIFLQVFFTPSADISVTNYTIKAFPPGGGAPITAPASGSPGIIASLPLNDYTFTVSANGSGGSSPDGASASISTVRPNPVKNVTTQLSP